MVRPQKVSKKKVKVLITSSEWNLDVEATNRLPSDIFVHSIYVGPNDNVLQVLEDGIGFLYQTRNDWTASMAEIEALASTPSTTHVLKGRLPHGQRFSEVASELSESLHLQLDLEASQLDSSMDSLRSVDQAIQQIGPSECLSPRLFEPLLAYLGEIVRRRNQDVHWRMVSSTDLDGEDIWEPWLVVSQREIPIFIWLYDELYEQEQTSIYSLLSRL